MKRRIITLRYILVALLAITLAVMAGCATKQKTTDTTANNAASTSAPETYTRGEVKTADEAKQLLIDGNKRYTSDQVLADDVSKAKIEELAKGQYPFATILTCSDSRVSPEILFDQGLGDIFIVRTAGNVVDSIATGSVEYGAEHLKTPLLVVLGHSKCGAVKATVEAVEKGQTVEGNIGAIVSKIKPSVEKAKTEGAKDAELFTKSEDDNVEAVIADLEKSPVLKEMVEKGELKIVGAKYQVESGQVDFFEAKKETKAEPAAETKK